MTLTNIHNNLKIVIKESLLKEIGEIAICHFPKEFGGFLIGRYSTDFKSVEVEEFILPKKYKGTSVSFQRSTENIEDLFQEEFIKNGRYYVGEWHTHPNGSTMYSKTDLNAMIETVECSTVSILNPLLLILSINHRKIKDYKFYYYSEQKFYEYE